MIISKREAIYRRDSRTCVYCRRHEDDLPQSNPLTLDHLVPLVAGGKGEPENLVTACSACNKRKGHQALEWFVGSKRAAEITAQAKRPLDYMAGMQKNHLGVLVPRPSAPAYPTSRNNKLHDLVRDLIEMIGERHPPAIARGLRHRARTLGVKFPEWDSPTGPDSEPEAPAPDLP